MTAILLPPWRVAASLPGLRIAALLAFLDPAFVGWAGKESDTGLRLVLAGMAAAVALALVWDDRSAALTAATPVGLPSVRVGRGSVVLAVLAAGWAVCALVADRAVPETPVAAIAVPVVALAVLLLAVVGLLARGRDGEPVGAYAAPALLVLLLLLSRLPRRWTLLVPPDSPAWPQASDRWLVLLAVSAGVLLWLVRDPAARPLSTIVRTRLRPAP